MSNPKDDNFANSDDFTNLSEGDSFPLEVDAIGDFLTESRKAYERKEEEMRLKADAITRKELSEMLELTVNQVIHFESKLPSEAFVDRPGLRRQYFSRAFFKPISEMPQEERPIRFNWYPSLKGERPEPTFSSTTGLPKHLIPYIGKAEEAQNAVIQEVFSYSPTTNDASFLLTPFHAEPKLIDEITINTHPLAAIIEEVADSNEFIWRVFPTKLLADSTCKVLGRTEVNLLLLHLIHELICHQNRIRLRNVEFSFAAGFNQAFNLRSAFMRILPINDFEPQLVFMQTIGDTAGISDLKEEIGIKWRSTHMLAFRAGYEELMPAILSAIESTFPKTFSLIPLES